MNNVKFLHLADTHIGRSHSSMRSINGENLMTYDASCAFDLAVNLAITQKVNFVLHSGDMFDHTFISRRSINQTLKALQRLNKAGIRFIVVAGNHDYSKNRFGSPLEQISILANVRVVSTPLTIRFQIKNTPIAIHCIPYQSQSMLDRFDEIQEKLLLKQSIINILVMHQSIVGFNLGFNIELTSEPRILLNQISQVYNYVALGHIHLRQSLRHPANGECILHYPSSPFITSFTERNETKGLSVVMITERGTEIMDFPVLLRNFIEYKVEFENPNAMQLEDVIQNLIALFDKDEDFLGLRLSGDLHHSVESSLDPHLYKIENLAGLSFYKGLVNWID